MILWYIFNITYQEPAASIFREIMEAANSSETLGTCYDIHLHKTVLASGKVSAQSYTDIPYMNF
jgi:hypothetical protein